MTKTWRKVLYPISVFSVNADSKEEENQSSGSSWGESFHTRPLLATRTPGSSASILTGFIASQGANWALVSGNG
jgi:hypothetical protein